MLETLHVSKLKDSFGVIVDDGALPRPAAARVRHGPAAGRARCTSAASFDRNTIRRMHRSQIKSTAAPVAYFR